MAEAIWIALEDVASQLSRTVREIYEFCREGQLEYKKEEGKLFISRESLEIFRFLHDSPKYARPSLISYSNGHSAESPEMQAVAEAQVMEQPEEMAEMTSTEEIVEMTSTEETVEMELEGDKKMDIKEQPHYTEILASIRVRMTKHAEMQEAFFSGILGLLDSLQEVCNVEEQKGSQLTNEITHILSKYTKGLEQPEPAPKNTQDQDGVVPVVTSPQSNGVGAH